MRVSSPDARAVLLILGTTVLIVYGMGRWVGRNHRPAMAGAG